MCQNTTSGKVCCTYMEVELEHINSNDVSPKHKALSIFQNMSVRLLIQTAEYGTFRRDLGCGKPKQFIFRCAKSFSGGEKFLQARLSCTLDVGH